LRRPPARNLAGAEGEEGFTFRSDEASSLEGNGCEACWEVLDATDPGKEDRTVGQHTT
jgi:hypothetical protein